MAALTIRKLDESIKRRLRVRAAEHGVSMEEEVRVILRDALQPGVNDQQDAESPSVVLGPDGNPEGWRLKASFADIMALAARPPVDFDQKAVTDELYAYLEEG